MLGPVLKEKEKAEEALKASGLVWTIIRPGGLKSEVRGAQLLLLRMFLL